MDWTIPRMSGQLLQVPLGVGDRLFIVGTNGSGKSALIQDFVSSRQDEKIRRLSAHRKTWLESGSIDLTPLDRKNFDQYFMKSEKQMQARWRDEYAQQNQSAVLFDLVAKENTRARSITRYIDDKNTEKAIGLASESVSLFDQINELLALGTLTVLLENPIDQEILARHRNDNASFSIAQMSNGERNAVIIAATVLTVEAGTTLLIDEPERHFHRSIIEPFLSALFERRRDCTFVVSTHEIGLPVGNPEARVIMVRSCEWNGDRPKAWDVEVLEANTDLPEELKRAILGARRRILFVEGKSSSLDLPLYNALFPGLSVVPIGSCVEVQRAVSGLRNSPNLHHIEAFGLIDQDDREKDQIDKLAEDGIFALNVCSVEALYYCSDVISAVAHRQAESFGRNADDMIQTANEETFKTLDKPDLAEQMAARRCERLVRNEMLSKLPDTERIKTNQTSNIFACVNSPYPAELDSFKKLVADKNLDGLIARYPLRESSVFSEIARALKCTSRNDYERLVVARVEADKALAQSLKKRIHPLSDKLS